MSHLRTQVRTAIQSLLMAANTAAGTRVYAGVVYPLAMDGPWPQLTIASDPGEAIDTVGIGLQRTQERTYRVRISAYTKAVASADVESALDAVGLQVEAALAGSALTLGGAAKFITLRQCNVELTGEGEEPGGRLDMIYDVTLYAREGAPDVLT